MEAERAELKLKPESFSNLKALKMSTRRNYRYLNFDGATGTAISSNDDANGVKEYIWDTSQPFTSEIVSVGSGQYNLYLDFDSMVGTCTVKLEVSANKIDWQDLYGQDGSLASLSSTDNYPLFVDEVTRGFIRATFTALSTSGQVSLIFSEVH